MEFEKLFLAGEKCFNFLKNDWKQLFFRILKIELFSLLVLACTAIICGAVIAYLLISHYSNFSMYTWLILGGIAVVGIVGVFLSALINTAVYETVRSRYERKEDAAIKPEIRKNLLLYFLYWMVFVVFYGLILLILGYAFLYGSGIMNMANLGVNSYNSYSAIETYFNLGIMFFVVVSALVTFFAQFGIFELLLERKGVVSSIAKSFSLVKNNFVVALAFSFVAVVLSTIIEIPFIIVEYAILIVTIMSIGFFAVLISNIWSIAIAVALIGAVFLALEAVRIALHTAILLPFHYLFWKALNNELAVSNGKIADKETKKSAKRKPNIKK